MSSAIPHAAPFTAPISEKNTKEVPSQLDKYIFWGLLIYLTTVAFEGPVRFVLSQLKIATLLYARDLIPASVIFASLVLKRPNFGHQKVQLQLIIYLLITTLFATVLLSNGFFSGLFAIKLFSTFLLGLAGYTAIIAYPQRFKYATIILFCITLVGVLINKFYVYPWEGGSFESAFGTTDMSRVWWVAGGERRLAGFTRASPVAAGIIAITGAAMMVSIRNYWTRIIIIVAGITGIYLTTSKGLILSYLAVSAIAALPMQSTVRTVAAKSFATLFFVLGLFAPLVSWIFNPGFSFLRSSPRLVSSFADRMSNSWPETVDGFTHWYNWIVGQGLGSVGLPAYFSGKMRHIPAVDNLHLFLMGNFGLIGTMIFAFFFARLFTYANNQRSISNSAFAVALIGLGYGTVSNIADDSFSPIILGLAWGLLSQPKSAHATPD